MAKDAVRVFLVGVGVGRVTPNPNPSSLAAFGVWFDCGSYPSGVDSEVTQGHFCFLILHRLQVAIPSKTMQFWCWLLATGVFDRQQSQALRSFQGQLIIRFFSFSVASTSSMVLDKVYNRTIQISPIQFDWLTFAFLAGARDQVVGPVFTGIDAFDAFEATD